MTTKTVTVEEAQNRLLELISLVGKGEEVLISCSYPSKVKLVVVEDKSDRRLFGQYENKIWISPDFDDLLPDHVWRGE